MKDSPTIVLYTDGASLGNPGKAGVGFILYTPQHQLIKKEAKFIGTATNNVAEYLALIYGMQQALREGAKELICYTDSELLVNQLAGKYKVRSKNLLLFYNQVKHLETLFDRVRFSYISRDNNIEADRLAKKAARG
ncbi:ribonuclease HI family protein [Candidatus Aerophobetes bacterium]|nr:ribonuclease HI family protein [Candidatus Aerophobetes bacterium]